MTKITDRVVGHWKSLLPHFGVPSHFLNGKHGPCPFCQGKDRFRFDDRQGKGTFICSQCGAGTGWTFLERWHGWDFKEAAREIEKVIGDLPPPRVPKERKPNTLEAMRRIWKASHPIEKGDIVDTYLRARGLEFEAFPLNLRTCESWPMREGKTDRHLPMLVSCICAPDGSYSQMQRTYLRPDGLGKIERRTLPGSIAPGSAVRLFEHDKTLGIAEGVETALSAHKIFGVPVWAALNTSLLKSWEPPEGVERVLIFGDRDPTFAGHVAAYHLANKLMIGSRSLAVTVHIPDEPGDWNDRLLAEQAPPL